VPNDADLDLVVYVISGVHTCQPDSGYYYKKKLGKVSKKIAFFEYMKEGLEEDKVDMSPTVQATFDALFAHIGMIDVLNKCSHKQ